MIAAYLAVTIAYSLWLKHEPVIDLAAVAAGFVFRAIAGGVATGVTLSDWFLIVAGAGSLFMVTGKRHAEQVELGDASHGHRSTLADYSDAYLRYVRAVASAVMLTAYCLWAFENASATGDTTWFRLSIVPVRARGAALRARHRAGRRRRARGGRAQRPGDPDPRRALDRLVRARRPWLTPDTRGRAAHRLGPHRADRRARRRARRRRRRRRAARACGRRGLIARGLGPELRRRGAERGRHRARRDRARRPSGDARHRSRTGVARVAAGVSIDALIRAALPLGYFVPVTPGTRFVTIGGALAADVHGKNHHVDGSIANHVESFTLHTPKQVVEVTPASDPELFWGTAGALGLTGVVTEVTLRLLPVETSLLRSHTERCRDLDTVMARMLEEDAGHRYSVAWIDCLARGAIARSVGPLARRPRPARRPPAAQARTILWPSTPARSCRRRRGRRTGC